MSRRGILLALFGAGAALRLAGLDRASFWSDEAQSVWIALAPSAAAVWEQTGRATYEPPLFNVMLHGMLAATGAVTEFSARLLPWLAGVAGLLVVFRLARLTLEPGAALLACGLAAFAPYQAVLAQECRMYSCLFALEAGSAACLLAAVAAAPRVRARWWAGYAACLAGAALTHHMAVAWGVAHATLVLLDGRARRAWCGFALASTPAALIAAALLMARRSQMAELLVPRDVPLQELAGTLHDALALGGGGMGLDPGPRWAVVGLVALLVGRGAVVLGTRRLFPAVHVIVPLLFLHALHRFSGIHYPILRYAIGAQAALLLLVAAGLAAPGPRLRMRGASRLALAGILTASVVSLVRYERGDPPRFGLLQSKKPLRDVCTFLSGRLAPGDAVVHVSLNSCLPCRLYLPRVPQAYLLPSRDYDTPGGREVFGAPVPLARAVAGARRTWLISCPGSFSMPPDPPAELQPVLERVLGRPVRFEFPGVVVYLAPVLATVR